MSERGESALHLTWPSVGLGVLVTLAFLLRIYRLDSQSFWYDEAFTAYYAQAGIEALFRDVPAENHPPLHFLAVQAWENLAGSSEFSLRFLSVLFGVVAVPIVPAIVARVFSTQSRVIGFLSAIFLVLSPMHVWYSQEARMYSLATVLGLLSIYLLLRGLQDSRLWHWALYVLFTALGAFTHYYFVFVIVAEALFVICWFLLEPDHQERRLVSKWVGSQACILVLLLPLSIRAALVWDSNSTFWAGPLDIWFVLWQTAVSYAEGSTIAGRVADLSALAWVVLSALGVASAGLQQSGSRRHRTTRSLFLAVMLLVPLLLILAVSFTKPKVLPRYLLFSLPVFFVAVAVGVVGAANVVRGAFRVGTFGKVSGRSVGVAIAGALLVVPGLSLKNLYFDSTYARDDFRGLVAYVEANARPGDSVLIVGGHAEVAYDYYSKLSLPVSPIPKGRLPDISKPVGPEIVVFLNELANNSQRVWLVRWQSELADPSNHILHQLSLNANQQIVELGFKGLELYLFSLEPKPQFKADPDIRWRSETQFEDGLEFLGFDVDKLYVPVGDSIGVTLYWQANEKISEDLTVFIHLLDDSSSVKAQIDKRPVNDFYTTKQWQVGQIMRDEYYLKIPPGTPPGRYTLEAGVYRTSSGKRLKFLNGEGDSMNLIRPDVGPRQAGAENH